MHDLPKPNTQAVSWFLGEFQKKALRLDPKYQRKKVWTKQQQYFLIDSIISQCPIPQVYLNIVDHGVGSKRRTIYEVVDGQQRLTSVIEFILDQWPLEEVNRRIYPVSEIYASCIGKTYSTLPKSIQNSIWSYSIAVQELRDWTEQEIQALFRRLNIVNVGLTKQELRHSQYFGKFIRTVEKLADESFWSDISVFSPGDYRRMKDIEFISELLVVVIDGVQDQQKTLDVYFGRYELEFPQRTRYLSEFRWTLSSLSTIKDFLRDSRFSKKADLYGLFAAVLPIVRLHSKPLDLTYATESLESFNAKLEDPTDRDTDAKIYHQSVIEGANKLRKRQARVKVLTRLLKKT